ncbi:DUF4436 domain-containing protein [Mycobacterium kubicae]|uniref:DUF4436 domain-containing protein n=1 Tax=Mycobacterium kubicae TaxID=120959 RepID=A0AAX1JBT2_9MYCO|nr:DUF4436 domain-containing protein [Mycobacterium kubicae]MCV7096789.1 DUF4436 domain-containing protein [Mycobacterium kubicae]ORW01542.1 hypothetical protein AWC13_07080 [Mycobacterium kubicae]QNI10785.1 DUF4436 domain-containing protein [Mycobacterium kubicae]QPI38994.1 DUF4436 domain-containing protein [Mycobacterium kubicae]GFG63123.1 DUF4436 domain-containing protein [Mycobacterium kubicae]
MRWGIASVTAFVAAYVGLVALYALAGMGPSHPLTQATPASDGTTVTLDVVGIQPYRNALVADLTVSPGPALLNPRTGNLTEDLTVTVTSATTPTSRSWPKGTQPGVFPVSLNITGDVSDWPFDSYSSKPVSVDLFRGAPQLPERASVGFVDRLPGWKLDVEGGTTGDILTPYRAQVHRSPSTIALAIVLLGVLVALAGLGLFVAVQTARDKRKFQPPMTTWFAAMLFAVVPLRNALPDSPPFGAWIDVTVVLWVIVVLVLSMTLYVSCWWRHLRPEGQP